MHCPFTGLFSISAELFEQQFLSFLHFIMIYSLLKLLQMISSWKSESIVSYSESIINFLLLNPTDIFSFPLSWSLRAWFISSFKFLMLSFPLAFAHLFNGLYCSGLAFLFSSLNTFSLPMLIKPPGLSYHLPAMTPKSPMHPTTVSSTPEKLHLETAKALPIVSWSGFSLYQSLPFHCYQS